MKCKEESEVTIEDAAQKRAAMTLIALCWLVYTCSYVGKINYSANIIRIQEYFAIGNKSDVGLVSTLFFFSYGIGQVINGICCKKYNLKWMIFGSLIISSTINLIISFLPCFAPIKYLWVINGFSLSVLWPSLVRLLSETLPKKYMATASVIMGTTVAVGTFFVYGTSAIYSIFTSYKASFYTATAVLAVIAVIWITSISKIINLQKPDTCVAFQNDVSDGDIEENPANGAKTTRKSKKAVYIMMCVLAIYGVIANLIKDGLGTWVPSILKENYKLPDSLSIILTLALPLVAIFGNFIAVKINGKINDFVYHCALMFVISGVITSGVMISFKHEAPWVFALFGFTVVSLLSSSCNSLITSIVPLFVRDEVNSGLTAGVLNGFCYLGSTLSTYGLALIVDKYGWMAMFSTLCAACAVSVVCAAVYSIIRKFTVKEK